MINEPGIVRWIVDGLLIPLLVALTVIVMRAVYLGAARRRMRRYLAEVGATGGEAGEESRRTQTNRPGRLSSASPCGARRRRSWAGSAADDTPPRPGILRFLGLRPESG